MVVNRQAPLVQVGQQPPKRCIPEVITFEWFFNRRPPKARRTRRGSRW